MPRPLRRTILFLAAGGALLLLLALPALHYLDAAAQPARAARLAGELGLRPGMTVAEVGAGSGAFAIEMARLVGARGHVIATELGDERLRSLRDAASRSGLPNLRVSAAGEHETNLPPACCDAIYMQRVYHHLTDPAGVIASVRRALKSSGTLAVIEFEPSFLRRLFAPPDAPRKGEGVTRDGLVREMQAFGFRLRNPMSSWGEMYLAIFTAAAPGPQTRPRGASRAPALYAD